MNLKDWQKTRKFIAAFSGGGGVIFGNKNSDGCYGWVKEHEFENGFFMIAFGLLTVSI